MSERSRKFRAYTSLGWVAFLTFTSVRCFDAAFDEEHPTKLVLLGAFGLVAAFIEGRRAFMLLSRVGDPDE